MGKYLACIFHCKYVQYIKVITSQLSKHHMSQPLSNEHARMDKYRKSHIWPKISCVPVYADFLQMLLNHGSLPGNDERIKIIWALDFLIVHHRILSVLCRVTLNIVGYYIKCHSLPMVISVHNRKLKLPLMVALSGLFNDVPPSNNG